MACQKKAVPVITERKQEPTKTIGKTSPLGSTIAPDTTLGKTIFVNRCGKCHGLPELIQYNAKKWDEILLSMIPKAKLTDEQGIHVTAYVKLNVKEN